MSSADTMIKRYAHLLTNLLYAIAQRVLRLLKPSVLFLSLSACMGPSAAKHVLFSPISGSVVVAGKPAAGATVKRWYRGGYNDSEATDTVTTDTSGRFSFPLATFSSIAANFIPHEPVITQKIFVVISGTETLIYATVKRNYDNNGEYGGQPLSFVFDPTAQPTFVGPSPTIRVTLSAHPLNP